MVNRLIAKIVSCQIDTWLTAIAAASIGRYYQHPFQLNTNQSRDKD
jgi:hypothetical protein